MRFFPFALSMLFCVACFAQMRPITDSVNSVAEEVYRGETLSIGYDTGYVLNKNYFNLVVKNIDHAISMNDFNKNIIAAYKATNTQLKKELIQKENFYQELKKNYELLNSATTAMVDRTDRRLEDVGKSLANARTDLDSVKSSLNLSLAGLKTQRTRQWEFALGGFGVGVGVTTLVFLLAR